MDLANYKKVWKNQPEEKNKISALEIYKMTQSKSNSIVKWIFIIGLLEFVILNSLVFFIDLNKAYQEYEKIGLKNFIIITEVLYYIVAVIFLIMFYLNYRNIDVNDSSRLLFGKILKTRKTVKLYVFFNLTYIFIIMIVVSISFIRMNSEKIPKDKIGLVIGLFALVGLFLLGTIWAFYQLLYGFLLKKLKRNYKELSKLKMK